MILTLIVVVFVCTEILSNLSGIWHAKCLSNRILGDEIDKITQVNTLTGEVLKSRTSYFIPCDSFLTNDEVMNVALPEIKTDMENKWLPWKNQEIVGSTTTQATNDI